MQPKNSLKAFQFVNNALMLGQVLFAVIAFVIVYKNGRLIEGENLDRILQLVVVLIALPLVIFGLKWYQKKVLTIRNNNDTPAEKFASFRTVLLQLLVMIETPALLSIISFLFTGNWAFMLLFGMLLLFFASLQPSKIKLLLLLALNEKDLKGI